MRHSRFARFLALFIAAQFLNVQIQTAFATEAVTSADPAAAQVLKRLEEKVTAKFGEWSEQKQLKLAYRLYQRDVKMRNRMFRKSDEEVQKRVQALNDGTPYESAEPVTAEDRSLRAEVESDELLPEVTQAAARTPLKRADIRRERILKNTDPLLLSLGATALADGSLQKADFQTFQAKVFELGAQELRAPAMSIVLKVILALLVVTVGLYALLFIVVVAAFAGGWGTLTVGGAVLLTLLAAGVVIGMFYALKGIFSADAGPRGRAGALASA